MTSKIFGSAKSVSGTRVISLVLTCWTTGGTITGVREGVTGGGLTGGGGGGGFPTTMTGEAELGGCPIRMTAGSLFFGSFWMFFATTSSVLYTSPILVRVPFCISEKTGTSISG